MLKQGNEAVAGRRYDLLPDLNQQFHHELAEAGRNRVLCEADPEFSAESQTRVA